MKGAFRVGALVLVTFVAWSPDSALARQYLKCLTKKVVIVDTPKGRRRIVYDPRFDRAVPLDGW